MKMQFEFSLGVQININLRRIRKKISSPDKIIQRLRLLFHSACRYVICNTSETYTAVDNLYLNYEYLQVLYLQLGPANLINDRLPNHYVI